MALNQRILQRERDARLAALEEIFIAPEGKQKIIDQYYDPEDGSPVFEVQS